MRSFKSFTLFIVCPSLLVISFIIGMHLHSFKASSILLIQTICAVLTTLAAIATAYIAKTALSTWRAQFNYAEKFKSLVDLENKSKNYIDAYEKYYVEYYNKLANSKHNELNGIECSNVHEVLHSKYISLYDDFTIALSYSFSFLSDKEKIELEAIHQATLVLFKEARNLANEDYINDFKDGYNSCAMASQFYEQYQQFEDCVRKLRK